MPDATGTGSDVTAAVGSGVDRRVDEGAAPPPPERVPDARIRAALGHHARVTPPAPDDARWAVLGRGLAQHPDDGLVLMRAVRDDAGAVVDFVHEWVNEATERNARRALLGRSVVEVYGDVPLVGDLRGLLGSGTWRQMLVEFGSDPADPATPARTFEVYLCDVGGDRVAGQYRDVTELRRARRLLEFQAGHDELTGVPNRRLLREHLDRALALTADGGPSVLVLLADLDRFKQVNDGHGHLAGDRLLRLAAERMRSAMRASDLVARYGGDEFVIVCHAVSDRAEADALAGRLRSAVAGRYRIDAGTEVEVGVSVGYALTDVAVPAEVLLERADRALYAAKSGGRDQAAAA